MFSYSFITNYTEYACTQHIRKPLYLYFSNIFYIIYVPKYYVWQQQQHFIDKIGKLKSFTNDANDAFETSISRYIYIMALSFEKGNNNNYLSTESKR